MVQRFENRYKYRRKSFPARPRPAELPASDSRRGQHWELGCLRLHSFKREHLPLRTVGERHTRGVYLAFSIQACVVSHKGRAAPCLKLRGSPERRAPILKAHLGAPSLGLLGWEDRREERNE